MVKRGILVDFVWSYVAKGGDIAIEDSETHKVALIACEDIALIKALRRDFGKSGASYKGREVLYQVNSLGALVGFRFVG